MKLQYLLLFMIVLLIFQVPEVAYAVKRDEGVLFFDRFIRSAPVTLILFTLGGWGIFYLYVGDRNESEQKQLLAISSVFLLLFLFCYRFYIWVSSTRH